MSTQEPASAATTSSSGAGGGVKSGGQQQRERTRSVSSASSLAEEDAVKKVEVISQTSNHSATFVLTDEDHTLGNALRYMLMRNPDVSFCGYTVPHPSEAKVHIRVQTDPNTDTTADDAFRESLHSLMAICDHVETTFDASMEAQSATGQSA